MREELLGLRDKVDRLTTISSSVVALLSRLTELIRQNAEARAELRLLADEVDAQSAIIAKAITSNTPSIRG